MSKLKKPEKENYFGEKEEKAVIEYLSSKDNDEKNYIYTKYLHEPIEKLVKGLLQKYPRYVGSCGIDELEARAYIQVYNAIQGFDYTKIGKDGKNVKAFSYLGTICNNYYKTHSLQANKKESINDDIGQYNLDYIEQQIKELKRLLKPNGTIIIAVPNFKSFDAKYYKEFWAAYDVPRHLWHFSKISIEKLVAKENMKLVKILPMVFDSFYVSLLSEKYKNGKMNFFKAFFIGLKSNIKAKQSLEYSSHIYVIKNN